MDNWTVYKHTTPSNKFYFGITNCSDLNKRWLNGLGYRTQKVFFRAIIKYGWDNIKHEIIKTGLSLEEAKELEKYLINKYKTNVTEFKRGANGYNMTPGGDTAPSVFMQEDESYRKTMYEKVWSKNNITIDCYDYTTKKYLCTYESLTQASKELKIDKKDISKNINNKVNRVKNYIFTKHGEEIQFTKKLYEKPVSQFDMTGNFLKQFKSCADASRYVNNGLTNGSSMIAKCAKGERNSYRGYLWKYEW